MGGFDKEQMHYVALGGIDGCPALAKSERLLGYEHSQVGTDETEWIALFENAFGSASEVSDSTTDGANELSPRQDREVSFTQRASLAKNASHQEGGVSDSNKNKTSFSGFYETEYEDDVSVRRDEAYSRLNTAFAPQKNINRTELRVPIDSRAISLGLDTCSQQKTLLEFAGLSESSAYNTLSIRQILRG